MPSSRAARRAISLASSGSTWITPSSTLVSMIAGMKPAPIPWIGCGPGSPPERTGRKRRLDRENLEIRPFLLQHLGAGGDVAAGADAGDQRVDRRSRGNRRGFPAPSCGGELRGWRDSRTAAASRSAVGFATISCGAGDRALHALFARREVEGRAIGEHQPAALDAHAFGHDQDQLVALDRRDHREADAGIAGGRLDDRRRRASACRYCSASSIIAKRDAVLDRRAGVRPAPT